MFLSIDPDIDIKVSMFLLVVCVFFALWFYKKTKRLLVSLVLFSILGNSVFLLYGYSLMYKVYSIEWLSIFSLFIWPIINALLILLITKNRFFIFWWLSFAGDSIFASSFAWKVSFYWFTVFSLEIWPMINLVLFVIIAVKLLRNPNKFLNLAGK